MAHEDIETGCSSYSNSVVFMLYSSGPSLGRSAVHHAKGVAIMQALDKTVQNRSARGDVQRSASAHRPSSARSRWLPTSSSSASRCVRLWIPVGPGGVREVAVSRHARSCVLRAQACLPPSCKQFTCAEPALKSLACQVHIENSRDEEMMLVTPKGNLSEFKAM